MNLKGTNSAAAAEAARKAAAEAARKAAAEAARKAAAAVARQQALASQGRNQAPQEAVADSHRHNTGLADAFADMADAPEMDADEPEVMTGLAGLQAAFALSPRDAQAAEALQYMQDLRAQVLGLPPEAVPAIANLLYDPSTFYQQGQAMVGTRYQDHARPEAEAIAGAANGPTLAERLQEEPNLSTYPEETLNQLASFREAPSEEVQQALDRAAEATLESDDFDPADLNPAIAHIIKTSQNPEIKEKLEGKLKDWAKQKLEDSLEGKEKDSGVEEGLGEFQEAIVELAEKTGLGEELQTIAENTLKDGEGLIEETAKRGRSLWDKFTGAVSGFIDKAFGAIGDGISKAIGAVGDVAKFALDKTGDVWEKGLDLAAAGFDAVGLEGAGNVARKAGDVVDGAYDFVGDQTNNFVDGFGDGIGGTVTGIGSVIAHPIDTVKGLAHIVTHPQDIPKIGKALWEEASEHGIAGALGYATAQVLPAILSGGSSAGASVSARLGALAGKSQLLSTGIALAKGSKVGQIASKVVQGANYARQLPSQAISFVAKNSVGRLATKIGQQPVIRKIAERIGTSAPVEALKRVTSAIQQRKFALNSKIDNALGTGLQRLDDSVLGTRLNNQLGSALKTQTQGRIDDLIRATRVPGEADTFTRRAFDEAQAATEPEFAARAARIDEDAAVIGRNLDNRPPGSAGSVRDFEQVDEVFETLRAENPELLRSVHQQAYRDAGLDPAEIEKFIEDYTTSSNNVRKEVFQGINDSAGHIFSGNPPRPGNDYDRIIHGIQSTRTQRAQYVSDVLGVPVPDRVTVFRGTDSEATLARGIDSLINGRPDSAFDINSRGVSSSSLDPRVPADFGRKGSLQAETVGHAVDELGNPVVDATGRKQYWEPKSGYVALEFDVDQAQVLFDKYVDGGRSALGPTNQTLQREFLLGAPEGSLSTTADRVSVGLGDRVFTIDDSADDILQAVAQHGSSRLKDELAKLGITLPSI